VIAVFRHASPLTSLRLCTARRSYVIVFRHVLPLTYLPSPFPNPQVVCDRRLPPRLAADLLCSALSSFVIAVLRHALLTYLPSACPARRKYVVTVFLHASPLTSL
jgi:hypothetical protein